MNNEAVLCGLRRLALRLRRCFATRHTEARSIPTILREQWLATERLAICVRVLYVFPAFWMTTKLFSWEQLVSVSHPEWLWPVMWLSWFEGPRAPTVVLCACLAGSWVASACCAFRWARVVGLVALVEFLGLCFANGKIHHLMHGWVLTLMALVALPRDFGSPMALTRGARLQTLLVYGLAQTLFALTYTLSGIGKVVGLFYQLWQHEVTALHPQAFSRHVAARLLETGDVSVLGSLAIQHGACLWPFVVATVYLQLCALHLAARPALHRVLACGLIGFHMSSAATLFIDFTPAIVLAGVLFGASATAPHGSWHTRVLDLPLVGALVLRLRPPSTRLLLRPWTLGPQRKGRSIVQRQRKIRRSPIVDAWRAVQLRTRGKL